MIGTVNYNKNDWITIKEIYEVILEDETKYSTIDKLVREIEKKQNKEITSKGGKVSKNKKNRKIVNIKALDIILEKIMGIDINNIKEENEENIVTYHISNYKIMNNIDNELSKYPLNTEDINFENLQKNIKNLENYYKAIIKNKENHIKEMYTNYANDLALQNNEHQHKVEILNLKIDNLTELLKSSRELNEVYKKERDYFKNKNIN